MKNCIYSSKLLTIVALKLLSLRRAQFKIPMFPPKTNFQYVESTHELPAFIQKSSRLHPCPKSADDACCVFPTPSWIDLVKCKCAFPLDAHYWTWTNEYPHSCNRKQDL